MWSNSELSKESKEIDAQETMTALAEIAEILNTGLDREALAFCVSLCEAGVNPEALAAVIKELRLEAKSIAEN